MRVEKSVREREELNLLQSGEDGIQAVESAREGDVGRGEDQYLHLGYNTWCKNPPRRY